MKIVVTAQGADLDSLTSPVFGRSPFMVVVETDTMSATGMPNPSASAGGGAGIQAAQWVVDEGARAVLSLNVGPNAFAVLSQAGIPVYRIEGGTVREVAQAFADGRLQQLQVPNVTSHSGLAGRGRL